MKVKEWENWIESRCHDYVDKNYCVVALNEEAGEVAGWWKKAVLRGNKDYTEQMLAEELGDVLFYLTKLAKLYGWSLKDLMSMNIEKLSKREGKAK